MSGRRCGAGAFARTLLVVGLVAVVAFWVLLLASDGVVSPFAFADPAVEVFLALAIVHVLSAPMAWIAALTVTVRCSRPAWLVFDAVVVPVAAVVSLLVLMTDAVVWRDDLGEWAKAMGLALLGPTTLAMAIVASLRMKGRDGTRE